LFPRGILSDRHETSIEGIPPQQEEPAKDITRQEEPTNATLIGRQEDDLDMTVDQAESRGIIFTYYPLSVASNTYSPTRVVSVIIPDVILSIMSRDLGANSLPHFQGNPWELTRHV